MADELVAIVLLTEALHAARMLSPESARTIGAQTDDPMLRSVCEWRGSDSNEARSQFDSLLRAAKIGQLAARGSTLDQALCALREGPKTAAELVPYTSDISVGSVTTIVTRLRRQGHAITFARSRKGAPALYTLWT